MKRYHAQPLHSTINNPFYPQFFSRGKGRRGERKKKEGKGGEGGRERRREGRKAGYNYLYYVESSLLTTTSYTSPFFRPRSSYTKFRVSLFSENYPRTCLSSKPSLPSHMSVSTTGHPVTNSFVQEKVKKGKKSHFNIRFL